MSLIYYLKLNFHNLYIFTGDEFTNFVVSFIKLAKRNRLNDFLLLKA
jgi:hypothetical protein